MEKKELRYFEMAKELNETFHEDLLKKEAHFRGNINSYSLISLNEETPEIGKTNIKSKYPKEKLDKFHPDKPKRITPEKSLQAWVILNAIRNDNQLPFGDNLTFITSELVIALEKGKIVNDILAIDKENNLVVIELKSSRVNQVKQQALDFKEEIESRKSFFQQLTKLMTGREWNGKIRCMVVWPKASGKTRRDIEKYRKVEEYQYFDAYKFEKVEATTKL